MEPILPILQKIKQSLETLIQLNKKLGNGGVNNALCNIANKVFPDNKQDFLPNLKATAFRAYLLGVNKRKRVYYDCNGKKGRKGDYGFHWHPNDTKSRLKWLDKQIAIETENLKNE